MFEHVVIVGGGFSGAMLAVNLLRGPGPRVTLVERGPAPALGLAYGAAHQSHLLNVRAGNMSAFPDEPGHFAAWLAERGQADAAAAFAPRPVYGAYLQELLAEAQRREGARLAIVNASAIALETSEGGASVTLEDGRRIQADAAALATGNLPPHPPRGLDPRGLSPGRYWGDPWAPGVAGGLQRTDRVLIIGTGLTMVDVALLLDASGFTGRIDAISRRGLLPHAHAAAAPPDRPRQQAPATLPSALLREVRARGEAIGWRQAVDELRPFTQKMWRAASDPERGRFLRHLRPWWDVHRHRIAPAVHERIQAMIDCGRLVPAAGKLISFKDAAEGVEVSWRPRGSEA
ncbi:MAG TPA: FAD/NAD(P)-binding protein, partial [Allosphingosinicella sp.]